MWKLLSTLRAAEDKPCLPRPHIWGLPQTRFRVYRAWNLGSGVQFKVWVLGVGVVRVQFRVWGAGGGGARPESLNLKLYILRLISCNLYPRPYLDPRSRRNNSPKHLKTAQKGIILHTFGV